MAVEAVDFGEIKINGETYYSDMIIWWKGDPEYHEKFHIFDADLFLKLASKNPEIIVLGDGVMDRVKVTDDVAQAAEQRGIQFFVERSKKAASILNAFLLQHKKVVGIIHC
jgi:hypothetical protein